MTNDKIFDEPIYNYTRDFPFPWEETRIPISANYEIAEQILLECVKQHTEDVQKVSAPLRRLMEEKYFIQVDDMIPRVYYRLTDNWIELTVRFIVRKHGIRIMKDAISRSLLKSFSAYGIEIASSTFEVMGLPPVQLRMSYESRPKAA